MEYDYWRYLFILRRLMASVKLSAELSAEQNAPLII